MAVAKQATSLPNTRGISVGIASAIALVLLVVAALALSAYRETISPWTSTATETTTTSLTTGPTSTSTVPTALTETRLPAPDLQLTDVEGNVFRLTDFRARVIVLTVLRIEDEPSRLQLEELKSTGKTVDPQEVKIVLLDYHPDDSAGALKSYLTQQNVTWTAVWDTSPKVSQAYPAPGTPTTFVVDKQFRLASRFVGLVTSSELEATVSRLLRE